jgi:hypothetical protein
MTKQTAAGSQMNIAQQNASMRAALLATAPRMRKNVLTATTSQGLTTRMKLFNVGVLTKLQLYVTAAITIGVAVVTPSPKAPWNLLNRIRLTDYDGTDRINLSGFQLFVLNCVRNRTNFGYHNSAATAAVFTNPVVPTAIGNATMSFFIDIPLAFDVDNPIVQLQDLRGAILAQTAVGEMYLSIDTNPSLISATFDVDSVYGNATATVVGNPATNFINITMWQEYMLPQAIGGAGQIPLPQIDLMTVYELNGNLRSSDNVAVNTQKLISYPNVRSVIGAYFNYVQAGLQTQGKINGFQLIANGNNILIDHTELSQLFYQRTYMLDDEDTVAGTYFRDHRAKPIETALFGNVQMGITPNTAGGGNQYVEVSYESFYTKGQALPGLNQAQ